MLHSLPVSNILLQPCSVDSSQFTPVAAGQYCASCQRTVHDFTQATAAEVEQARTASADGRLCGRFRSGQLHPGSRPMRLRPKLRLFLAALVLVVVQGLSAQQAWAQIKPTPHLASHPLPIDLRLNESPPDSARKHAKEAPDQHVYGIMIDQMPTYPGGLDALAAYLGTNIRYPDSLAATVQGKVFISFLVTRTGQITNAQVVRNLHPVLDAEALRVIRQMPAWEPGRQNGAPVEMTYTFPITFSNDAGRPAPRKRPR